MRSPDAKLRRVWGAGLVVMLAGALVACGGEKGGQQQQQQGKAGGPKPRGGTVVVGMRDDFGPLNPVVNTDQYTDELIKYGLYTPLIQFDEKLNPVPYLAQSWEMTGDTGVVFHLRHDVYWHDAVPVRAQDVKFTFDLAKNPATASMLAESYLSKVDRAQVVDSFTIRFHFSAPHAQAIQDFWWAPVPEHVLARIPPDQLRNADFNRRPVGSGPYHFNMWQANDRLVVEREGSFPAALGGPPALDRVVFRIIPEPSTLIAELLSGGIHVDVPLDPEQISNVRGNSKLQLFAFPGRTVYFIAWNNKRPPFTDARVRRAMTQAIDSKQISDALLMGYGKEATSPIPPWSPLAPDVKPLAVDRKQAMQLLADAGYTIKGNAQWVTNAAGQP
ncbi:MAG TPA: ABC transporter substrate-binding protein, partial [Longimicrobiales bacterium]